MIQDQFTCGEEGHDDQEINYLCLNYNCKSNSPCCILCVKQFHKEHILQCPKLNEIGNYFEVNQIKLLEQEIISNMEQQKNQFQKQISLVRKVVQEVIDQQQFQKGKQTQYVLDQYLNQLRKIDTIRTAAMQISESYMTELSNLISNRKENEKFAQIIETRVKQANQVMDELVQFANNQNKIIEEMANLVPKIKQPNTEDSNIENLPGYSYYISILRGLLEQNIQFEDPDFPPNEISSGYQSLWARVGEYCKKDIKFFSNDKGNLFGSSQQMEMRDIMQGLNGNEILSQVVCLIANSNPKELQRVFITQEISANNIYALKLLKEGVEQIITVDDFIPFSYEYEIPQTVIGQNGAIWIAILEKAIMKLYGSYYIGYAKAPPMLIETILCGPTIQKQSSNPSILEFIREELSQQSFLSCFDNLEEYTICQILGIDKITHPQQGEVELIQLRTPKIKWWTGDWSYQSTRWTSQLKQQLDLDAKTKLGIFYMDRTSFYQYFPIVYSCRRNMNVCNQLLVSQRKNQATYFKLVVENPGKYAVSVRSQDNSQLMINNKISIFKVEEDKSYTFIDSFYNIMMQKQEIFNLTKGTYIGYVRVYWNTQQEADATISVSGQHKVQLLQIQKIQNLVKIALGKEAKSKGRLVNQNGLEQRILELPLKGWFVMAIQNSSSLPFIMTFPKFPQSKYMKPNYDNQQITFMPGQSEIVVGKIQLLVKKSQLNNVVGLILSGFNG